MERARGGEGEAHELSEIVDAIVASYRRDPRAHHIGRRFLPSRDEIIEIAELLLQLVYPGYFGRQGLTEECITYHVGDLVSTLREKLRRQIELCLCYARECEGHSQRLPPELEAEAARLASTFLARIPEVRTTLITDVQAAFDGDPAATNLDEIILAYPGVLAITIYRFAHELHRMGIALMPRIMTEWAHARTGADIHPGATIGPGFFLDHATGAVIGETTRIGKNVKLYQGVTLGALSHPRDERGRVIREDQRHPTVQDGVTIYANATVLGGQTVVGEGALVGGSVFLTRSVPPRSRVVLRPEELPLRETGELEE